MFCPGDQPLLSRDTIASLLLSATNKPESIWRVCCDAAPGSPVLFPRWAFPELLTLPEGKGGGVILKRYPEKCALYPVSDPWELTDADYGLLTLDISSADLIDGLRDGLTGVRSGEHCEILFSGKYGFGKRPFGIVPANTALLFEIWVEAVSNE
jgi:hypothetical protein